LNIKDLERTLVMGLAVLELASDDCGTQHFLEILVTSRKHAQTLVGKWYRDPQEYSLDWKVLDLKTATSFINKKIQIRSTMTCEEPNFKICKKCFGVRKFPTNNVGVTAGQSLAERITQLILRTFHTSGGASLETDEMILEYFRDHLIDIEKIDQNIKLVFDNNEFPESLVNNSIIYNCIDTDYDNNSIIFGDDLRESSNKDIISTMNQIKTIALKKSKITKSPTEYYQDLMALLLEVGVVYSSFVEMLFTNMLIVDYENKKFWRYNQSETATEKLGSRMMASYISPLLGLLYEPNKNSIDKINIDVDQLLESEVLTIYERIWLGKI
jgi:hypothetical protein